MTREEEIILVARTRADRHQIAEIELNNGNNKLYFYDRIYNAEIASFEAGIEWADKFPKSLWVNAKNDLPCNHEEFIIDTPFGKVTEEVLVLTAKGYDIAYMDYEDEWKWSIRKAISHWMPIPKLTIHS